MQYHSTHSTHFNDFSTGGFCFSCSQHGKTSFLHLQIERLIQISQPEMAGVERAKKALWALLRNFDVGGTVKLTVTTARGKLTVNLEESFTKHSNVLPNIKSPKRASPSQLRRKERRAADPALRQRAAERESVSAAGEAAAAPLPSPEKVRCSSANISLKTSPVKDDFREEVLDGAVEKPPRVQVPHDFEDRANNDYFHDFEKVKEAEKILRETDSCCFCDFICPPPSNCKRMMTVQVHLGFLRAFGITLKKPIT